MQRRGEQPLALVVFFCVTQEVADASAHHAWPRPPTPPPPVVPVGHLPAVPQGRGRADGVGAAQAGGHGGFEGERLLLAAVRGVGVFVQGQVGLGDVALRGGVRALLRVPGAGGRGPAPLAALQDLGGQEGAALAAVSGGRDAARVPKQGAVGKEGPRLRRDRGELPTTSPWGAGVRDGGDGAFTQGARALYSRRDMAGEPGQASSLLRSPAPPTGTLGGCMLQEGSEVACALPQGTSP